MRKAVIIFFLFTVILFGLFSEAWDSQITAYKTGQTTNGTVPAPVCNLLRILDVTNAEMSNNEVEWVPSSYRNVKYNAFTWILGGNVFGPVIITFTFNPMYIDTIAHDDYIPYDVELQHTSSRIGNTAIASCIGNQTATTQYVTTNDFTTFSYYYVDSVFYKEAKNSVSVINASQEIEITYDMSDKTVVKENAADVDNYPYDVCNYWNRYGSGSVTLKIGADGSRPENHPLYSSASTKYSSGNYYADVIISIRSDM